MGAHTAVRVHTVFAGLWFVLAIATTGWAVWDPESKLLMAWVIFMSAYANCAAHLAGRAGAAPSEGEEHES